MSMPFSMNGMNVLWEKRRRPKTEIQGLLRILGQMIRREVKELHKEGVRLCHLGQPGLTGWAQICYPYPDSKRSSREKRQYDLYYLKNASLGFDLLILLQTVHTILWGSGAR